MPSDAPSIIVGQDDYIKQLRPISHPDLVGADPDATASKTVCDMFVSLRGALAYAALTQSWIIVYVVSLQRIQKPTHLQVRRLSAITGELLQCPKRSYTRP